MNNFIKNKKYILIYIFLYKIYIFLYKKYIINFKNNKKIKIILHILFIKKLYDIKLNKKLKYEKKTNIYWYFKFSFKKYLI